MLRAICFAVFYLISSGVLAGERPIIVCEPSGSGASTGEIFPEPYLPGDGRICFNVQGWANFSGNNCLRSGEVVRWKAFRLIVVDGLSYGRNDFEFRALDADLTDSSIKYRIEFRRDGEWRRMQDVAIDRYSGAAVLYFNNEHGGSSFSCELRQRKF